MEYYSAIKSNETAAAVEMGMNLEPVTQSEVSQKEKNKYHILMYLYGIQKNGAYEPMWLVDIVVRQKLTQHCKAIILQ